MDDNSADKEWRAKAVIRKRWTLKKVTNSFLLFNRHTTTAKFVWPL